jgi:hypothetical protein
MKTKSIHTTLAVLGLSALCWSSANAQLPLPVYEPFPASYTNAPNDGTTAVPAGGALYPYRNMRNGPTATVWSIGGASGGGSAVTVGGAAVLAYPGLYQLPGSVGCFIRTNNTTATRSPGILFTTVSSGRLYASLLVNVQASPSEVSGVHRLFAKLDSAITGTGGSAMAGVWLTSSNTLALSKSSNSATSADTGVPVGTNLAHLIVLRYTWNPDVDDDEVALWVDPPAGAFNVPEGSVPAPSLTTSSGLDVASISSFYLYHIGSEVVASMFLDEVRVGATWADVTPNQAPCNAASVSTHPASQTVNEGIAATFSVIPGGAFPTFQWQVSANAGATWQNVTDGIGATTTTYSTRPLTPTDDGIQYRVIVNVACGAGSTATSDPATITVRPAVATPVGVIVDDVFQDYWYNNLPYGPSNSVWFATAASSLDAMSGTAMYGYPLAGTSVTWLGYFTDDSVTNLPVHLAVGTALKGTLVFKGSNIVTSNGAVRLGFFDYADGSTRPVADGFTPTAPGTVRGYMVALNYGTIFSGNPFSLYVRNNLTSTDLMGTVNNYQGLGGGPGGYAGTPAFQNDTPYTLDFTIARKSLTNVDLTVTVTGNGSTWTHTRSDTTYAYPRFDCLGFRAGSAEGSANPFEFNRLLVQVVALPPDPIPLNITGSGANVTLTWSNPAFKLQSASAANGSFTDVASASSPYVVPASGNARFYRLVWP